MGGGGCTCHSEIKPEFGSRVRAKFLTIEQHVRVCQLLTKPGYSLPLLFATTTRFTTVAENTKKFVLTCLVFELRRISGICFFFILGFGALGEGT